MSQPANLPHDPRAIARAVRLLEPLARYHRLDVRGLERWPSGPALLVGNHNSGAGLTDALFLTHVYRRYGFSEPIHVLGHQALFELPGGRRLLSSLGVLPASPDNARRALEAGRKVLVFPGTDYDSMRPYRDRKRVVFAGHKGFARLAIATGAPIVPVVNAGAHETFVVLAQGRRVAKALRIPQLLRWHSMPIVLSIPWGVTVGPMSYLPYLPLPAKVTVEIGTPIDPSVIANASDDAATAIYDTVLSAMQSTLDRLYAERRFPLIG